MIPSVLRIIAVLIFFISGLANAQATSAPLPSSNEASPQIAPPPPHSYDPSIFQKRLPADQLTFLTRFAGSASGDLYRNKEFHKLLKSFVPDCMYHYGKDMPLLDALEMVFHGSPAPALFRDGRYLSLFSHGGPYLRGRGFLWLDLQEGIGLGGFYFQPTNGEPSPALSVFSRQVKEETLKMSQLPPEFAADLAQWSSASRLPPITARYFLTGSNRRILLEHDEDYCSPPKGNPCDQMNADAADVDLNAAYYLEQVHYATNATAWMISPDQMAWINARNSACQAGPNPLLCRIRMTRERIVIINRRPRHT